MYNDAVWSLNWRSGTAAWRPRPGNPAGHKGDDVAVRLRRVVFTAPPVRDAAPRELLGGGGVYEVGPSGVDLAPYRSNLVSLAANLDGSPNSLTCCCRKFPSFWMTNMSLCEERWMRRTLLWTTVGSFDLTWTVLSGTTRNGT